jgi:hypothetical protein
VVLIVNQTRLIRTLKCVLIVGRGGKGKGEHEFQLD